MFVIVKKNMSLFFEDIWKTNAATVIGEATEGAEPPLYKTKMILYIITRIFSIT